MARGFFLLAGYTSCHQISKHWRKLKALTGFILPLSTTGLLRKGHCCFCTGSDTSTTVNVSWLYAVLLHAAWVVDDANCILVMLICVSVCPTLLHGPGCNLGEWLVPWGGVPSVVVHHWADLQSVHRFCCYDNRAWMRNASRCLYSLYAWFLFSNNGDISLLDTSGVHYSTVFVVCCGFFSVRYMLSPVRPSVCRL